MRISLNVLAIVALASCGTGTTPAAPVGDTDATLSANDGVSSADTSGAKDAAAPDTATADAATADMVSGDTATADTGPSQDTGSTADAASGGAVTFSQVFNKVIKVNGCNTDYCHGGGAAEMLLTDEKTSYASLVNKTAKTAVCGQTIRVVPGKPDQSVLWYRVRPLALDGLPPCTEKMPPQSSGLPDELAAIVKAWIVAGAKP